MAERPIRVIPIEYQEVMDLLHSDCLRDVEQDIARQTGKRIIEDFSPACTSYTQADMSVSGMTATETRELLKANRDQIIAFGVAFLRDEEATRNEEEFPEGEEQDPSETIAALGLGTGFGIKYAIFYNFLANGTSADFSAYLKNRRIPHQAKFARELRRVFDASKAG
jgi:hypothetical protein